MLAPTTPPGPGIQLNTSGIGAGADIDMGAVADMGMSAGVGAGEDEGASCIHPGTPHGIPNSISSRNTCIITSCIASGISCSTPSTIALFWPVFFCRSTCCPGVGGASGRARAFSSCNGAQENEAQDNRAQDNGS